MEKEFQQQHINNKKICFIKNVLKLHMEGKENWNL